MKQVYEFLIEHSFKLMMGGFLLSVIGLIIYLNNRFAGTSTAKIGFAMVITGLSIYVIGRILVVIQRRRKKKAPQSDSLL